MPLVSPHEAKKVINAWEETLVAMLRIKSSLKKSILIYIKKKEGTLWFSLEKV